MGCSHGWRAPRPSSHTSDFATHLWTSAGRCATASNLGAVDPSALIFVALAVAWAVYLVPKALRDHDHAVRTRSVDRFSHTMRVLARREPVDGRSARLVVTPGRPAAEAVPAAPAAPADGAPPAPEAAPAPVLSPAQLRARRAAAKRATKRRRTVLAVLLLATLTVVGLAAFAVVPWWSVAIPAGLVAAWLVLCRVMVKGERAALAPRAVAPSPARVPNAAAPSATAAAPQAEHAAASVPAEAQSAPAVEGDDPMADTSAGLAAVVDPTLWDPVPVTLPTYVSKPQATRRTVRTIDLDSTGVWTSGRTDADAQLARDAEEADRADRAARRQREADADQRAVGS